MLKNRIITAVLLLAVLIPVLFFGSKFAIILVCALFLGVACWESLRLFGHQLIIPSSLIWTGMFVWLALSGTQSQMMLIWWLSLLAWLLKFIPSLQFGLPARTTSANRLISVFYLISIVGCFLAIIRFQQHSAIYLLSVLVIVWLADIGAYFTGKAFGKRKLAPIISPGKSWEGVLGGWLSVLILGAFSTQIAFLNDTFSTYLLRNIGWLGLLGVLTLLVAASVVGDLVESQLKRRANVKDSSHLLPGHGGVLDRIDALVSVLPLAILVQIVVGLIAGKMH